MGDFEDGASTTVGFSFLNCLESLQMENFEDREL
jgi:hypothetical protein